MISLSRDIARAAREEHDVIIVGGGIYGAMLMLEASKAGLKPLLVEASDFGGNTSLNNLRIVHGGLRYLQSMHFSRFRDSVQERQWYLKTFPDLVTPIECLMPLYGQFPKNNLTLKAALLLNDLLSHKRNEGVVPSHHLPNGTVLSASETRHRFPSVRSQGLTGGALWFDAVMPDCHRILIETLRWSVAARGTALNHVSANELLLSRSKVVGVIARDEVTQQLVELRSKVVVNATGPQCLETAREFDSSTPPFYRASVAWNLLLDREPLSAGAVAIQAPQSGSQVYFAHSLNGKLLLGTGHQGVSGERESKVLPGQISKMLNDLNYAIPGIDVSGADVIHVFEGLLPVKQAGGVDLSDEATIIKHQDQGGPVGLYSVSGVKFTTARSTAQAIISQICLRHDLHQANDLDFPQRPEPAAYELDDDLMSDAKTLDRINQLIATESPLYLEDLFFRRSNLLLKPDRARMLAAKLELALPWKYDLPL